jgi:hypothetical protein
MEDSAPSTSLGKRLIALLVLAVAGFILLKFVIHVLVGVATVAIIVLAIGGVIWALRTL